MERQVAAVERMSAKPQEEMSFSFGGGRVEYDAEEIRFNIFFDEKPEAEMRANLKKRGFKWSPKRGAWTRGAKTIRVSDLKTILT